MKKKLKALWSHMSTKIPDEENAKEKYIKETEDENPENKLCQPGQFTLVSFKFSNPLLAHSHFYITLSWQENEGGKHIRYHCQSYMLLEDFINFLKESKV